MIFGGALRNMIDRLINGYVVDYVALFSFPRFNVADASLTLGIAVIAIYEFQRSRFTSTEDKPGND